MSIDTANEPPKEPTGNKDHFLPTVPHHKTRTLADNRAPGIRRAFFFTRSQQHSKKEVMRRIFVAAALAALITTAAACGGDGEEARQQRLHPVLHDVTYQQAQQGQEYILQWGDFSNRHLLDKINALHQMGYEIRHTTRDRSNNFVLIFRKIGDPEESVSLTGTTPTN